MQSFILLLLAFNQFIQCWSSPLNTPSKMILFRDALKIQNPLFTKWNGDHNYCEWSGVKCKNGDVFSM
jgi:hypothetical protein